MSTSRYHVLPFALFPIVCLTGALAACPPQYTTTSVASLNYLDQASGGRWPSISADGSKVVFSTILQGVVPGDTNLKTDVFVRDRTTGTTILVSTGWDGSQGNGHSNNWMGGGNAISADGRFVVFTSLATNLVPVDTNGKQDIFVRDLLSATTTCASVSSVGDPANGDSGATETLSTTGDNTRPEISADGRFVVFDSLASNLVVGDTNGVRDVFVRDLVAGTTTRVSLTTSGGQSADASTACSISGDGRYVAYVRSSAGSGRKQTPQSEVFVHDRLSGATTLVSVSTTGGSANGSSHAPALNADGRYVVFFSYASNLVTDDTGSKSDVFVRDLQAGVTRRVSLTASGGQAAGNSQSITGCVSDDGRYILFWSEAKNLVPNDTNNWADFFVRDTWANTTTRVSVGDQGQQGNGVATWGGALDRSGSAIAFGSNATNLITGLSLGPGIIYLRE